MFVLAYMSKEGIDPIDDLSFHRAEYDNADAIRPERLICYNIDSLFWNHHNSFIHAQLLLQFLIFLLMLGDTIEIQWIDIIFSYSTPVLVKHGSRVYFLKLVILIIVFMTATGFELVGKIFIVATGFELVGKTFINATGSEPVVIYSLPLLGFEPMVVTHTAARPYSHVFIVLVTLPK